MMATDSQQQTETDAEAFSRLCDEWKELRGETAEVAAGWFFGALDVELQMNRGSQLTICRQLLQRAILFARETEAAFEDRNQQKTS